MRFPVQNSLHRDYNLFTRRETNIVVGNETIVDAFGCDAVALRDLQRLQALLARIMEDLQLKSAATPLWHVFGGEGGITGLVLLTESHLTCHTYPEFGLATINLYSCSEKPEWDWDRRLAEILGAKEVAVSRVPRGVGSRSMAEPR